MIGSQTGASGSVNDGGGVGYIDWGHHSLGSLKGNSYTVAVKGGSVPFAIYHTTYVPRTPNTSGLCSEKLLH